MRQHRYVKACAAVFIVVCTWYIVYDWGCSWCYSQPMLLWFTWFGSFLFRCSTLLHLLVVVLYYCYFALSIVIVAMLELYFLCFMVLLMVLCLTHFILLRFTWYCFVLAWLDFALVTLIALLPSHMTNRHSQCHAAHLLLLGTTFSVPPSTLGFNTTFTQWCLNQPLWHLTHLNLKKNVIIWSHKNSKKVQILYSQTTLILMSKLSGQN